MNLKNYLKILGRNEKIALLYFNDQEELVCETYDHKGYIPKEYLCYEIMDIVNEDDFREVWIKDESN